MTSAKPQSMAAQTEAPDDLIAELARLMADEARSDKPDDRPKPVPVRIPGDTAEAPAQRPQAPETAAPAVEPTSLRPAIRIPGDQNADAPEPVEPFSFDFGLGNARTEPTMSPAPQVVPTAAPAPKDEPEDLAPLDQDSLADLIAAELAQDRSAPEPVRQPEPEDTSASADSFGMPPIFGLGDGTPRTVQPQPTEDAPPPAAPAPVATPEPPAQASPASAHGTSDPLDDIERLVGPAVRLATANPPPASPALRSLATPTVATPVQAEPAEPATVETPPAKPATAERASDLSSVDEAILAAAAATGAHVEWVNDGPDAPRAPEADTEALPPPARAPMRLNRAVAGPIVAIALLAVAGFGLYWVLGQGGGTDEPAPLLVADTTPTKEVPETPEAAEVPQSVVFNEISGADAGAEEQLVSRDQADTEAVVAANTAPAAAGVLASSDSSTVDPNQDGLVNRKVRTVTVRPDGTIVSGDDSLAGSSILPVDRPEVPEVPGADFSTPELVASAQQAEAAASTATSQATDVAATPAAATTAIAEPGADIPVVDANGAAIAGSTVRMPMERPADFASIASAAIASAAAAPAPAAAAAAPAAAPATPQPTTAVASGGSASAYVQLASQRSEEAARQSAQAIATRYGVLFGGASLEIQRVDLGERGIYYRVLVPANSRESAANICTNVKAAGGDCLLL